MIRKKQQIEFDRVLEKVAEARFFLDSIADYKKAPSEFGSYLSAFLSAFKSIYYRLECVIGKGRAKEAIQRLCSSLPAVKFLMEERDVEVHREGTKVQLVFVFSDEAAADTWVGPFRFPWESPWKSTFSWESGWKSTPEESPRLTWTFKDDPSQELVDLCRKCLGAMEGLVQEVANTSRGEAARKR